jgi:hypothetical protein
MALTYDALPGLISALKEEGLDWHASVVQGGDVLRVHVQVAKEVWHIDYSFGAGELVAVTQYSCGTYFRDRPTEHLSALFGRMPRAWKACAADLGVEFVSPFVLELPSHAPIEVTGLLPHFGGPKGTVICSRREATLAPELADTAGYNVPGLNPFWYEDYDRPRFMETLREWGWFGPSHLRPSWLEAVTE